MDQRLDTRRLSSILRDAPAWARLGLTLPDPGLRERAADALAATIVRRLAESGGAGGEDRDQLPLL
ncbi:DUF6771 family protein [Sphingomonas sanxanigenens]|uniref:Uncharacterized protein n=1 Tax=Sphingomonas sanxanigenens DSM 19645 = NX02 TaxID=1123269 RepID=W0AA95_9SPHN|nr:DUF6771 family protein [Sphingomonas sanxanigenens]AHE54864.1 hypothetical protein NX02_15920 [Sphingomonas sanxanigenens DSM 19645 = NX02]